MREFIYTTVFFLMGLALIVSLSFHRASATSSTQVEPLPPTKPQAVECYGSVEINTAKWKETLACDDNKTTAACQDSDHPNGGIVTGYTYDCTGGDWESGGDCTNHCYAICASTEAPQANCKWTGAPP